MRVASRTPSSDQLATRACFTRRSPVTSSTITNLDPERSRKFRYHNPLEMRRLLLVALALVLAVFGAVTYEALARDRDYQGQLASGDRAMADGQTFDAIQDYSGAIALRPDSVLARLR